MIVYLDTSAMVPLLVAEPSTPLCRTLWDEADAVVTCRLTYVEAAAALAQAERLGRMTTAQRVAARELLNRLWVEFDVVEVGDTLVRHAADLAATYGLRGYDAVHCAAAAHLDDPDLVAATGDRKLLYAWRSLHLATADTTTEQTDTPWRTSPRRGHARRDEQ